MRRGLFVLCLCVLMVPQVAGAADLSVRSDWTVQTGGSVSLPYGEDASQASSQLERSDRFLRLEDGTVLVGTRKYGASASWSFEPTYTAGNAYYNNAWVKLSLPADMASANTTVAVAMRAAGSSSMMTNRLGQGPYWLDVAGAPYLKVGTRTLHGTSQASGSVQTLGGYTYTGSGISAVQSVPGSPTRFVREALTESVLLGVIRNSVFNGRAWLAFNGSQQMVVVDLVNVSTSGSDVTIHLAPGRVNSTSQSSIAVTSAWNNDTAGREYSAVMLHEVRGGVSTSAAVIGAVQAATESTATYYTTGEIVSGGDQGTWEVVDDDLSEPESPPEPLTDDTFGWPDWMSGGFEKARNWLTDQLANLQGSVSGVFAPLTLLTDVFGE